MNGRIATDGDSRPKVVGFWPWSYDDPTRPSLRVDLSPALPGAADYSPSPEEIVLVENSRRTPPENVC